MDFLAALFFLVRPMCVLFGLAGAKEPALRLGMMVWFGLRDLSGQITSLTLLTIVVSIFAHAVTPLMRAYEKRREARGAAR